MSRSIHSFAPVFSLRAKVLILGSIPGEESLRRSQYYAHPQNQFWDIMEGLAGAGRNLPYKDRLKKLKACRMALWDVAASCVRAGSMDGCIVPGSVQTNDFEGLFKKCPEIAAVFFNGKKAFELFMRKVWPDIQARRPGLLLTVLPSTSPAYASMSLAEKRLRWKKVRDFLESAKAF